MFFPLMAVLPLWTKYTISADDLSEPIYQTVISETYCFDHAAQK